MRDDGFQAPPANVLESVRAEAFATLTPRTSASTHLGLVHRVYPEGHELKLVGNMVIAPGGGWVGDPQNIASVRPPSQLIYLRVRPETALKRLGPLRAMRPLLTRPDPLGELKRLLEAREPAYQSADHVVDTELFALQRVIEMVTELAPGSR